MPISHSILPLKYFHSLELGEILKLFQNHDIKWKRENHSLSSFLIKIVKLNVYCNTTECLIEKMSLFEV